MQLTSYRTRFSLLSMLFTVWMMAGPRVYPQPKSSATAQSPVSKSTQSLQTLLDKQQRAISSGDPAAVAASSKALTQLAAQLIDEIHAARKRSGRSPEEVEGLKVRESQLTQVLANAFNDWGTAEAREQQYGEALKHFQEAERWKPSTPGLMRNLGTAAFQVENYGESARALAPVVSSNPDDASSRMMLAMSQFSLERFTEAEKNFTPISQLVMQDPRTAYAWAYTLVRTHQPLQADAIADILSGRDLPPDARLLVCKLYTASENFERAVSCLRTLLAQNPSMPDVYYELGATLIRLDRPAEAIPELQTALKLDPRDLDAKYDLAYALLETQQKGAAIPLLQSVLAVNPNYSEAQYQLGKVLLDQDKVDEAAKHLEASAKLDPDNAIVHYQLQVAYRRMGRKEDANRELERYKDLKDSLRNNVATPGVQRAKQPE
jgi:tetratricopeptide (TPR) repeat protein